MTQTVSPPGASHNQAPLTPMSLESLMARIDHEWATRNRIFDLPTARYWKPDPEIDLGFDFLGRRCDSPVGPAAGPHSQLAQNIVLAWLGGSRLFELKTVQVLDELEIARPCIDMQTVGYNIEWSQELTVAQSIDEYVKASMMLAVLSRWEPLAPHVGEAVGNYVFDMSVGYDLAGISGDKVSGFLRSMADASAHIDRLRSELTGPWAPFADLDFDPVIADTLTLSTFHGCPPEEIEGITKHLIDVGDLDVIVKLNPTLLGYETVADIINDQLGYADVSVRKEAFAEDLQFDRGLELIGDLRQYAADRGRRFGIKLTNTLVVNNTKQWMPEDPMYLSGPPLHVLAMTLLHRLSTALPDVFDIPGHDGDVMVSFSAGITKDNLADALATGINPATVCSDLLKPGGYGRLAPMLKKLRAAMADAGAADLAQFRATQMAGATEAGFPSVAASHVAAILGDNIGSYSQEGNAKLPRTVDSTLQMFGCVACNFCITVCPNDAFFSVPSPDGLEHMGITGRQQYLVLAELCNECGNCMTFCPEDGDPAQIKPKLFTDPAAFASRADQGFLVANGSIVKHRSDDDQAAGVAALIGAGSVLPDAEGPAAQPASEDR